MQLRGRPPLGRQKWEHAITTLREQRNWPGQVRPTIEDDDEDEDDPIVGCQRLCRLCCRFCRLCRVCRL